MNHPELWIVCQETEAVHLRLIAVCTSATIAGELCLDESFLIWPFLGNTPGAIDAGRPQAFRPKQKV